MKDEPNFSGSVWSGISREAIDCIKLMLTKDPDQRPNAEEILKSKWFTQNKQLLPMAALASKKYLDSMAKFEANTKLSQAIMTFIVSNATYKDVNNDILNVFKEIDTNGDGKITQDELVYAYKKIYGYKNHELIIQEVQQIIQEIDSNISGSIDYTEFLVACMNREKMLSDKMVAMAFKQFDINGDGYITRAEFQAVMGGVILDEMSWNDFLLEADVDKDGSVSISFIFCKVLTFYFRYQKTNLLNL